MADYYVRKSGSDSNAGTSAGAAWLTIGKALGASGIASGDTVYIGAGTYREVVTVAMTSATAETKVVGDVSGQYTGDAGDVIWTAYVTNDTTAPVSANTCTLSARDYLTFQNLIIVAGTSSCIDSTTTTSTNITLYKCVLIGAPATNGVLIAATTVANTALNWVIDSCVLCNGRVGGIQITAPTSGSSDYNISVVIKNTLIINPYARALRGNTSGAGSFKGGGVTIYNCTVLAATGIETNTANWSTTYPINVYNSAIIATTGLSANTSGQIVEDYNSLCCTTNRTNVTAGSNSRVSDSPNLSYGRESLWGLRPIRAFFEPSESSPYLGFGAQSGGPTVDITGANRPSGGASTSYAVGAYERGNCMIRESSVTHAGTYSGKIPGPGYQDFQVPVDASSTTISIYARYDTNHAATNKPQIQVLNGGEIGVSDATATMTAAVDTWEELQLTFTPTAKGIVTIRCISRSAAGNGIAYFDS